jgi:hypothetical protein
MPPSASSNASFCSPSANTAKADRRPSFLEAYETDDKQNLRTQPLPFLASIILHLQLAAFWRNPKQAEIVASGAEFLSYKNEINFPLDCR